MKKIKAVFTKCLIKGAGSIFNIFGSAGFTRIYKSCESDFLCIKRDWHNVGRDIKKILTGGMG